jgi:hypothetical protein
MARAGCATARRTQVRLLGPWPHPPGEALCPMPPCRPPGLPGPGKDRMDGWMWKPMPHPCRNSEMRVWGMRWGGEQSEIKTQKSPETGCVGRAAQAETRAFVCTGPKMELAVPDTYEVDLLSDGLAWPCAVCLGQPVGHFAKPGTSGVGVRQRGLGLKLRRPGGLSASHALYSRHGVQCGADASAFRRKTRSGWLSPSLGYTAGLAVL